MTNKVKIISTLVILAFTFACGRYSVQAPTVHTKIDTIATKDTDTNKDTHKTSVTVTDKLPTGETKTTTTVTEDTVTNKHTQTDTKSSIDQTVTPAKVGTLNVSTLAGISLVTGRPVYGASVTKQLIGPLTIGIYGLTNGIIGASIGVNF